MASSIGSATVALCSTNLSCLDSHNCCSSCVEWHNGSL